MKTTVLFMVVLGGCQVAFTDTTPHRTKTESLQYTCRDLSRDMASYPGEENEVASPRVFSCHDNKCYATDVFSITPAVEEMVAIEGSWESASLILHDSIGRMIRLGITFPVREKGIVSSIKVTLFRFTYPSFMAIENGGLLAAFFTTAKNHREITRDGRLPLRHSGCRDVLLILTPSPPVPPRPSAPSQPQQI